MHAFTTKTRFLSLSKVFLSKDNQLIIPEHNSLHDKLTCQSSNRLFQLYCEWAVAGLRNNPSRRTKTSKQTIVNFIVLCASYETRESSSFNTYLPEQDARISKILRGHYIHPLKAQRGPFLLLFIHGC